MRQVVRGYSKRLRCMHTASGTLAAPDAYVIDVRDNLNQLVVDNEAMTEESTGYYYYDYTPAVTVSCGIYKASYKCTTGTFVAGLPAPDPYEYLEVLEELD